MVEDRYTNGCYNGSGQGRYTCNNNLNGNHVSSNGKSALMKSNCRVNGKEEVATGNGGRPLKITAVGDGMVGKTCMLITYTSQEFPTEYIPTVFDNFADVIKVGDIEYNVTLWDTAGQEDYERLRPLSYPNTDCFLLCYSISSKSSFDNIVSKWHPELKHHCPNVPIILVATKSDLRGTSLEAVTISEGKKMKHKIKAERHMECSALKNEGLNEIFCESVRHAIKKRPIKKRTCNFL